MNIYQNSIISFPTILIAAFLCFAFPAYAEETPFHGAPPYPGKIMKAEGSRSAGGGYLWHSPARSPERALAAKGTLKLIAVRCQFVEESNPLITGNGRSTVPRDKIVENMKSFCEYYRSASYNQLDVTVEVSVNLYDAPQKMSYYGDAAEGVSSISELVRDVFYASEYNPDKGRSDAARYIDYDNYDGIILVHAGVGQESDVANGGVGDTPQDIWSIALSDMSLPRRSGKLLNYAVVVPESEVQDGNPNNSPLGVTCHEFGHILGLPDLYDISGSSLGVGRWDLMGYGAWVDNGNHPVMFSSWTLIQLGYLSPVEVLASSSSLSLQALSRSPSALKIYARGKSSSTGEYFLLENREKTGVDSYIAGGGILVWHIDDSVGSVIGNAVNNDASHKRVDLEIAEGQDASGKDRFDYNTPGTNTMSDKDLFYTGYKTKFDAYTNPSSISYDKASAPVAVNVLSAPGETMNLSVTLSGTAVAKAVEISKAYFYPNPASSAGGRVYFFLNFTPTDVTLKIYDRSRSVVFERDLIGKVGPNEFLWDLRDEYMKEVANGTYLYRISARSAEGDAEKTGKIVVLR